MFKKEMVLEQLFDAPSEMLHRCWTEVEHLVKWIAPDGFRFEYKKAEIHTGGVAHIQMTSPEGMTLWEKSLYKEVSPSRLIFEIYFSDDQEVVIKNPFFPAMPEGMLSTVSLSDRGNQTKVELRWSPIEPTEEELAIFEQVIPQLKEGWVHRFKVLELYLKELDHG